MAVFAGKSGNTRLQVRGVNASTKVALYKANGSLYGNTDNNQSFLINYFPDQIRERIRERINASTEGNASIEIDEDGQYQVDVQKRARFLGIFKVRERVRFHVDPETGAILNEHAPWWGFLAKDEPAEDLLGASCGTVTPGQNDECCQNKGYDYWNSTAQECMYNSS